MQVFDGRLEGMKSLNRSSDALLSYSEEGGSPVFSIATSLMLSNLTVKSGAKGQVGRDHTPHFTLISLAALSPIGNVCLHPIRTESEDLQLV